MRVQSLTHTQKWREPTPPMHCGMHPLPTQLKKEQQCQALPLNKMEHGAF